MFANRLTELDLAAAKDTPAMSLSPDSSFSAPAPDVLSHVASSSSTPPTTVADSASLHSDASKHDVITVAVDVESVDVIMADAEPMVSDLEPKLERDATPVALAISTPVADAELAPVPSPNSTIMVESTTVIAEATTTPTSRVASEPAQDSTENTPSRVRRARGQAPVYNLAKLSGTDGHGKRRSKGDIVSNRRRRTVGTTSESVIVKEEKDASRRPARAARATIDALNLPSPAKASESPRARRQIHESPRSQRAVRGAASSLSASASLSDIRSLTSKMPEAAKRGRKEPMIKGKTKLPRELRNLRDTKEFAHVDEQPIIYTVWANGKYVDPSEAAAPARKRVKVQPKDASEEKEDSEPIINTKRRLVKKYLDKGLYSGQDAPIDISKGLTMAEKKKLAQLPELIPSGRVNSVMPTPLYTGLRMLIAGRDFKLPFQVCNPLPPGQPKPDEWKKMTKNRFIGESRDIWRKSPHYYDYQSKCVCKPEDGCGESCQNRIMLYECDTTNCNIGRPHCTNRAFADLTIRRAKGGKYRVGVEVIKTSDRGYGVRSNRCFRPHQIIMEYAGEIITDEECERRMNEEYKNNECYYLMSFDQNMIIDATTGSIARFVNHSCNPNCRMIKWIVSGQPRMALFAGDKPIMTGDELTYDYNFDPFSAKNVQKCLCGSENCRGVLGPKSRDVNKLDLKNAVKTVVKAGKRKLKDMVGGESRAGGPAKKKAKTQPVKSVKAALANMNAKAAIKKKVKVVKTTPKSAVKAKNGAVVKKTSRVVKTYGRTGPAKKTALASSAKKAVIKKVGPVKKTGPVKKPLAARKTMQPAAPSKVNPVKKTARTYTKKAVQDIAMADW